MESFVSAFLLTLSAVTSFGSSSVTSGQAIIVNSYQTIQNNSVTATIIPSPDLLYARVSIVRPWLPTFSPLPVVTPKPTVKPTPTFPVFGPTAPVGPTSPIFASPSPSPALFCQKQTCLYPLPVPTTLNRLEKHRLNL